ncbi:hypothetical protein [Ovoidimarina sediminis]|uniref:hypothetical protein n=1 Tax=Ovoidimarina sediminis TaxID=3079856 RepID=UPI002906CB26|nr:hypothetical protein [Rhodophyticola sp. MJ-SS7]MDU8943228.1 hypothetical protein [Rhodophyticola sp. MJ-SS7]
MHPLFRSLFLLALFALPAAHVTTGVLFTLLGQSAPGIASMADRVLTLALVRPFGATTAVYVLMGIGATLAILSYMNASRRGRPERHQTW